MPALPLADVAAALRAAGCVFAEDEARLLVERRRAPRPTSTALVERRVAGEPLEHVLGWAEFCGLRIAVDPGVFVPRRRTELLVRAGRTRSCGRATSWSTCAAAPARSATALVAAVPGIELHAVDIDPAAVACARRNLGRRAGYEGDLYDPLPAPLRGRVDVVVANAPYVPTDAIALMPPEARDHEPRVALDGGADGLDVQRRVAAAAPPWLAPGGSLLIETSERQAPPTAAAVAAAGLDPRVERSEELDGTAVVGSRA